MKLLKARAENVLSSYVEALRVVPQCAFDNHLRKYLSQNHSVGSTERKLLSSLVYSALRNYRLLEHAGARTWRQKIDRLDDLPNLASQNLPPQILYSIPQQLAAKLRYQYPDVDQAGLLRTLHSKAPVTVRVNQLKMDRDKLFDYWYHKKKLCVRKTKGSPWGIVFVGDTGQLSMMEEFKKGWFEVQDEASQIAALRVECRPGDTVVDYCSGGGGKALAIGPQLQGKGKLFLHDVRSLDKAKERVIRAGLTNVTFGIDFSRLVGKVDWLVLDVPCTGTGTLRRNPDVKLRYSEKLLNFMRVKQQEVVMKAMPLLGREGRLVYMTCSILKEENEEQVARMAKAHGLRESSQTLLPVQHGRDGFFVSVLRRK